MTGARHGYERFMLLLATGFGTGYSPIASGTVGTLPALLFMWFLWPVLPGWWLQLAFAVVLAAVAIPICSAAERQFQTKDDGRIVADEYLTFPICMLGLPMQPVMLAVAFVSCRVFDILKPEPADRVQAVKGGTGIVLDDVVAALYSLAVNHLIYHFLLK